MEPQGQCFKITGELTDLNSYIKAINSNRFLGNSLKQMETHKVVVYAKLAKLKPVEKYPVNIHYHWYSKDKRMDIDNVSFSKKFINDGLIKAGVLENDGRKQISGFRDFFFIDKNNPRVEVFINPVE